MKLLLLGMSGQVGMELRRWLPSGFEIKCCGRSEVNFEHLKTIRKIISEFQPEIIINAAAFTDVEKAEINSKLAFQVNAHAINLLAVEAAKINAWLIHYSTDYVFDGQKSSPYIESDFTRPLNVYGESKLAGEIAIRKAGGKHLIFRTSWVLGRDGNNFATKILNVALKKNVIQVIDDQFGAPTSCFLIARVTLEAIEAIKTGNEWPVGVYHLSPKGITTWMGVAKFLLGSAPKPVAGKFSSVEQLRAINTSEYPSVVRRPLYSCLNTNKLRYYLSFDLPEWEDDISPTISEIFMGKKPNGP